VALPLSADPTTVRLGSYLAIGFTAQLVTGLLGVGLAGDGGARVELVHPFLIGLAVALACGVRQARTALLVVTFVFLVLASFVAAVAFTTWSVVGMAVSALLLGLAAGQMAALSFTVPDAGLPAGVPERWRAWATSEWLHLAILLAALVAAFTAV
jgi:hypothetical protein